MNMKPKDRKIDIMGIVNITDDSYYRDSRCMDEGGNADIPKVLGRIGQMIREGATIIDIGACSTRPGSEPVGEENEWKRLEPVLAAVWRTFPEIPVSVDTYWASVVSNAFSLLTGIIRRNMTEDGSCGIESVTEAAKRRLIVNDISSGEEDSGMLPLVGKLGLTYIAMHKRGTPLTMQNLCEYDDIIEDILAYFHQFSKKAESAGIRDWILDPGFGFAKTISQNYSLMRGLDRFAEERFTSGEPDSDGAENSGTRHRILVGVSRKSMIYKKFGITPEESLPQTQVLHLAALQKGADILRVHDVAEAARTAELYKLL